MNSLLKRKISMPHARAINTFVINLPVRDQLISITLCLFCANSFDAGNTRNTYSIVGKIAGIDCDIAEATILAEYGSGNILKDHLSAINNQFIYSNYSIKPVVVKIKLQAKGLVRYVGTIEASVNIKLNYNLRQLIVNDVTTEYRLKNVAEINNTADVMVSA